MSHDKHHHAHHGLRALETGLIGGLTGGFAGGFAGALAGAGATYGFQSYQQHHPQQPQFNAGVDSYPQMSYGQNYTAFPLGGAYTIPNFK